MTEPRKPPTYRARGAARPPARSGAILCVMCGSRPDGTDLTHRSSHTWSWRAKRGGRTVLGIVALWPRTDPSALSSGHGDRLVDGTGRRTP